MSLVVTLMSQHSQLNPSFDGVAPQSEMKPLFNTLILVVGREEGGVRSL